MISSTNDMSSSSLLQWLQGTLSAPQLGTRPGTQGCASATGQPDTASFSQEAIQFNGTQSANPADGSQGTHGGHHHHHHHGGGTESSGSIVSQLAQAIANDTQKADGTAGPADSSQADSSISNTDDTFLQQLAGLISGKLLGAYEHTAGTPGGSQDDQTIHAIA